MTFLLNQKTTATIKDRESAAFKHVQYPGCTDTAAANQASCQCKFVALTQGQKIRRRIVIKPVLDKEAKRHN